MAEILRNTNLINYAGSLSSSDSNRVVLPGIIESMIAIYPIDEIGTVNSAAELRSKLEEMGFKFIKLDNFQFLPEKIDEERLQSFVKSNKDVCVVTNQIEEFIKILNKGNIITDKIHNHDSRRMILMSLVSKYGKYFAEAYDQENNQLRVNWLFKVDLSLQEINRNLTDEYHKFPEPNIQAVRNIINSAVYREDGRKYDELSNEEKIEISKRIVTTTGTALKFLCEEPKSARVLETSLN